MEELEKITIGKKRISLVKVKQIVILHSILETRRLNS
jgi:hypothetical protein